MCDLVKYGSQTAYTNIKIRFVTLKNKKIASKQ
uniref:Uncharacterized protein n=1 Tax=Anguilla anguilla TaxID=7936 RepID=A0A0E9TMG6_ANGAN